MAMKRGASRRSSLFELGDDNSLVDDNDVRKYNRKGLLLTKIVAAVIAEWNRERTRQILDNYSKRIWHKDAKTNQVKTVTR